MNGNHALMNRLDKGNGECFDFLDMDYNFCYIGIVLGNNGKNCMIHY